jgi:hypothetical protein
MTKTKAQNHCANKTHKFSYGAPWVLKRTTRSMRQGVNNLRHKQKNLKSILKKTLPIHPPKDCPTREPKYIQKLHQQGVLAGVYANAEDVRTVFPDGEGDIFDLFKPPSVNFTNV